MTSGRRRAMALGGARAYLSKLDERRADRVAVRLVELDLDGISFAGAGESLTRGSRVRLTVPARLWPPRRRIRVEGRVECWQPATSAGTIRFSGRVDWAALEALVERRGEYGAHDAGGYGSAVADAFRVLSLSLPTEGPGQRVVVVTSAVSGEGKSFIAAGLALERARVGGQVLLVDADLFRPTQHLTFEASGAPGVAQLLEAGADASAARFVQRTRSGVPLIPAGQVGPWPTALESRASVAALMSSLARHGDPLVVIDAPPVLSASGALVLAQAATDVVVAVRSGVSREREVQEALDLLRRHGAPLRGVVLNDHLDVASQAGRPLRAARGPAASGEPEGEPEGEQESGHPLVTAT